MTATPVERNYRPALRAERKRQSFYHDSAKNAEMYLTMKYGGDWWEKLTQETANVTGAPVNVPTQSDFTQEQKDALAEYARMRFEGYEGDPTALDNAYDAFKGSVRTGLSVLDAGVDWTRNIATSAALSGYNLGKNPNRHTFGEAVKTTVLPITRWKDAAYNTTLWTQIETALEGGMGAGFGAEGTGNGFYVNYDSPIGEEKARRAYEYASLENGEAASLGRLTAESIGWGKDTEQYKVLSGIVDGIAILTLDPLNLFTGGASATTKGAKVAQALKRVGITEDELPQALELIHRFGPTLDDADATTLVAEAFRTKARSRILNEHPDLKGLREQWLDDRMKRAAQSSSRDTDFIMDNLADIDDYRRLESTVDEVVKESSAATDNAVLRELEVDPKGATEQEARAAAERMGAEFDIEDAINDVPEGTYFHGTSQPVEGVSDSHYSPGNVYGQGLYVTDDRGIAQGYMKKKPLRIWPTKESEATDPRVYTVEEVEPVKFVDLDGPIPDSIMRMLRDGQAYSLTDEHDIIFDLIDSGEIKTLADLFDHIWRNLYATIDDKQEWFDSIRANLEVEGFGGYTHKGGRLTGGRPHNVRIYWFPESQVRLVPLEAPRAKLVKKPGFERVTDDGTTPPRSEATSFTTSNGSVYTRQQDGTYLRVQDQNNATSVNPPDSTRFSNTKFAANIDDATAIQMAHERGLFLVNDDGTLVGLRFIDDGLDKAEMMRLRRDELMGFDEAYVAAGGRIERINVTLADTPTKGSFPIEWDDAGNFHAGSEVSEVVAAKARDSADLATKPRGERVTDDGTTPPRSEDTPSLGGIPAVGEQAAPSPIRDSAERLDADPEDARRAAEYARNAAALEDETVQSYFEATEQLLDAYRAAGHNMADIDPEDFVAMLHAYHGLHSKGADISKAIKGLVGGNFDNIAKLIARTDNPADLYDMFPLWGADTLRDLAGVQDPHQVLMILFYWVLNGKITRASNRVARWSVQHGQSGHAGAAFMRRVVSLSRGGVPNSHLARFEDADSVVKLLSDFILEGASMTYRRKKSLEGWEEFRRDYLSQMIMAPTAEAKKRVWIEAQNEFLHRIPGWDSMDSTVQKQWTDKMRWTFDKNITQEARFADIRARMNRGMQSLIMGLADEPSTFNEDYAGLIHAASDLSGNVAMMDTKAIRKLFNVIEETGKLTAKGKAVNTATAINDWFDLYLRPLYLAMRPAYMLLQVADSGGRAMAIGATNLFTSPLQTMAIAAHLTYTGDTRIVKTLNKIMRSAPTNPDGTPMFGEAQMSALQGVLDDLNDTTIGQHLLRHQFRDFATRNSQTDSHMLDLGWQKIDRGKDNFYRGWAQTLMFHMTPGKYGDGMFQDVFDVMLGEIPQHVDEWADSTGKVYASREDMVTDYYFTGPGKDLFRKLIDSAQTKRQHIPLLQQIAQDRSKLHSFLWADDDAASVYNRVHDLTGQFDAPVMQTIRQITRAKAQWAHYLHTITPRKADKALSGKGKPFIREITLPDGKVVKLDVAKPNAVENLLASVARRVPEDAQPYAVRYRGHMANPDESAIKDFYEGALSWFFGHAGDAEKRLGQAPLLRDEVLLESAKRVSLLSRADAQVARDRIMAQIPRVKRTTKHHEIVAALKVGMPSGDQKGMFTLAEVTEAAQNAAYRKLSDVAYGIRGRNAGAQRLAIMLPFIQSWVNAARVYMKAAVLNPKKSANALRLLRTANTEESGVAYDVMPGVNRDDDPSKPLFWTDDMGNRNVSIPYLGYPVHIVDSALAKVLGGESNPNFEQFVNLRIDRWNPLNFGEPLPGVGPGVTFPASVIDRRVVTIPTELRKWWFAMQTGDVTQDKNILEGNLPWFIRELIPAEEDVQAQMGNAVMALVANDPEKYLDENGYILEDKVPALTRDAESLAMALYRGNLWRAALLRGGTSIPKTVKDKNGELIGLASLSNEFNAEVERTGSVGAGYAYLVDKYGPQGIAYLIGMRDRVPIANDEGYQFAADNQELFDKTYDVMGYFFPSSDMNGDPVMRLRSKQYQRMLTESGQNRLISPEDWAARFNEKAKAVRDLRLEQQFINGEITETQYEASKLQNGEDYQIAVSAGADTSRREDLRRQMDAALTNPTLRNTATGKALQSYLMHYDLVKAQAEGGSLDGEGDAPLRAYLRQQGEDLCVEFPEFIPIWRGTLMWEVDK